MYSRTHLVFALLVTACTVACGSGGPSKSGANNGADNNGATDGSTSTNNGVNPVNNGALPAPELPRDFIRSAPYERLELVVDHAPGTLPRDAAIEHVEKNVGEVVDKPGGVSFTIRNELTTPGADHVWTFDELNTLARERFEHPTAGTAAQIGLLYVDGSYEDDSGSSRVLGIAWANRFIVMFADSIESACDVPLVTSEVCDAAEASVLLHEVGHVIGLVDNGAPMVTDHKDPEHGHHDVDDECVMYWAYTSSDVIDVLLSRVGRNDLALTFGDACRADLEALR